MAPLRLFFFRNFLRGSISMSNAASISLRGRNSRCGFLAFVKFNEVLVLALVSVLDFVIGHSPAAESNVGEAE